MASFTEASKLALSRLRSYKPPAPTSWTTMPLSRRAAVLILLFPDKKGELRVVLTMRSTNLSSYSGQAALPGGKADSESETAFEVARREASEEIGLPEDPNVLAQREGKGSTDSAPRVKPLPKGFWVEELCEMPTNLAKTELVVRPCVAILHNSGSPGHPPSSSTTSQHESDIENEGTVEGGSIEENILPHLDAREVAAVFSAPFRSFLYTHDLPGQATDPSTKTTIPGQWYKGGWVDWHQQRWRMHNFFVPVANQMIYKPKRSGIKDEGQKAAVDQLEGLNRFKVWGMTARILVDAARYAYDMEPEFEHNSHFGDEEMIGRLRKIGRLGDIRRPGEVLTRETLRKAANL